MQVLSAKRGLHKKDTPLVDSSCLWGFVATFGKILGVMDCSIQHEIQAGRLTLKEEILLSNVVFCVIVSMIDHTVFISGAFVSSC